MRRRHPVHGGFHLAAIRGIAAARRRIVGATEFDNLTVRILHHLGTGDEVGAAQTHLAARGQAEELLRRIFAEVVALDVQLARERYLARACRRIFRVIDDVDLLHLPLGIVGERHLDRVEHRHHARRALVQVLADAVLELCDIDHVLLLRHTNARAEVADRLRRVAATAQAADRRHPRVVPPRDMALLHELQQLALAHHRVVQVQAGELDLLRPIALEQVVDAPVVERTMVFELQRAERVGDLLERVRDRVGVVVHRVDAPRIARAMVMRAADAVQRRIAHVEVRRPHVDLRAQDVRAVFERTGAHAREQVEALGDRTVAIRTVPARFGQRAPILADLVGGQFVDVGLVTSNELDGELVESLEVVGRVEHRVPREAEPRHVFLDRVDVFDVFLRRVGVIEPQVARAAALCRNTEVQTDRLGVADVQVPVRFRRETGDQPAVVVPGRTVLVDDRANEIDRRRRGCRRTFF